MCESNGYISDSEYSEDEIEPKLKYVRLGNELKTILNTTSATCIAVHTKFICIGSHSGEIYVLDHDGNPSQRLKAHSVSVNQISIDRSGESIASCSDDGRVFIHGLFTNLNNYNINIGRLVKTIALDPNYNKSPINKRFIIGDDKLTLYERAFLGGNRTTVLLETEDFVNSLCWGENFLALSSNVGVRVYDLNAKCSLGLIKWEEHPSTSIDKFRCNLRWSNSRTLLIGWIDTVRVCIIRKRSNVEMTVRALPEYLVDPVSTFQTDFYISGIAPLDQQLVLLGLPKDQDENNKSLRPQLHIIEYNDNDYTDICTDYLTLRGYQEYSVNDYHLDVLLEENVFFIVAPKDVIMASPYDLDDRIQWFIQHNKYKEALDILMHNDSREIQKHTVQSVGIDYLDYLLSREMYDTAGRLCLEIFAKNPSLWEDQIYKFASMHQLRAVSRYIPRTLESKLHPHIYEMVLFEYLKFDAQGFLHLIKELNHRLYNVSAVVNAVLDHVLHDHQDIFIEALAILYSYEEKYDKSLSMYLKLKHKDVFILIQKHNLHNVIHDKIIDLMDLDYKKTVALLLEKNNIPTDKIVEKLRSSPINLYRYLDEFDKKNTKGEYHKELVGLYAIFDRPKLLSFLKKSDRYPIREALDICQKKKYYPEMVFLLGRIGDTKEALDLIIRELKDMQYAVAFCHEHDDSDLWEDLIDHCINEPVFVTFLLQKIGSYIDPTTLITKIKNDMKVPGLKKSLVKMLNQYNLQVSVQEGCKKIVVSDYFSLQKKLIQVRQQGISISTDTLCGVCNYKIDLSEVKIFYCKHVFHRKCLELSDTTNCCVCYPYEKINN